MKLTKNQKIVLVIMIIVISLIIYNMFFRKSEHLTSDTEVDKKLEYLKSSYNIKNSIKSSNTNILNTSNIFLLASNVASSYQHLFFIYNNSIGMIKVNLSTGKIISSTHVNISKSNIKILFQNNGDLAIINTTDNKNLYSSNTVNKGFNSLSIEIVQNLLYFVFTNTETKDTDTFPVDRFLDDINIFLNADIIQNDLPIEIKRKVEQYLFQYNDKNTSYSMSTVENSSDSSESSWKCISIPSYNNTMAVKLNENGDPQCYSKDGINCWWGQCNNLSDAKPITCTATGNRSNSYDSSGVIPNWCTYTKNNFNNTTTGSTSGSTGSTSGMDSSATYTSSQMQNMPFYNVNCNIDFNNIETPVLKSCSLIKYI